MRRLLVFGTCALGLLGTGGVHAAREERQAMVLMLKPLAVTLFAEGASHGQVRLDIALSVPDPAAATVQERLPAITDAILIALHEEARLDVESGRAIPVARLAAVGSAAASRAAGAPVTLLLMDLSTG